ncbi:MAG: hypothetical protein ACE5KM_07800 [Planctomycetaceae bacterium]
MPLKPIQAQSAQRAASFAVAVWTTLCLTAIVLVSRRLAGAFAQFPHGAVTVLLSGLGFAAAWVSSLSMARSRRFCKRSASRWINVEAYAVTLLPPLLIGFSLTPADATATQMALLTLTVIAAVLTALSPTATRRDGQQAGDEGPDRAPNADGGTRRSHWLQRARSADGSRELLEGVVTVSFAPGQKQAVVHVSFCPLLSGVPDVDCEPTGDSDVRCNVAVRQPYGLRIDVRRSDVEEAEDVSLAWFAAAPFRRANAA